VDPAEPDLDGVDLGDVRHVAGCAADIPQGVVGIDTVTIKIDAV
jgi:hypothetical protein